MLITIRDVVYSLVLSWIRMRGLVGNTRTHNLSSSRYPIFITSLIGEREASSLPPVLLL